jgi:molecular chaperone DnaK (HSP70)/TM2 domain-containing membrane protein YozV
MQPGTTILGIDVGARQSAGCYYTLKRPLSADGATPVKSDGRLRRNNNEKYHPSYIKYDEAGAVQLVGESARAASDTFPAVTVFDVKPLLGKRFDDPGLQEQKRWLESQGRYELCEDNGMAMIRIGDRKISPGSAISEVIFTIIRDALLQDKSLRIDEIALTIPADYDESQRKLAFEAAVQAIRRVKATDAGNRISIDANDDEVEGVILVPDIYASLTAYVARARVSGKVMAFDMGYDALSIAICDVRLTKDAIKKREQLSVDILGACCDTAAGGKALDSLLLRHVEGRLEENDVQIGRAMALEIQDAVENAKEELSYAESCVIHFSFAGESITLSRQDFESIIAPVLERCRLDIENVMKKAGVRPGDIEYIALAGGSSSIPAVKALVSASAGVEIASIEGWDPVLCVAEGAAKLDLVTINELTRAPETPAVEPEIRRAAEVQEPPAQASVPAEAPHAITEPQITPDVPATAPVKPVGPIIGIDLGISRSTGCYNLSHDGKLAYEVVTNDLVRSGSLSQDKEKYFPSYVQYDASGTAISAGIKASLLGNFYNKTNIYGVMRFIGRRYDDPVVQEFIRVLKERDHFELIDENGQPKVRIGDKAVSAEDVVSEIIVQVLKDAFRQESLLSVTAMVLAVPAYFNDAQMARTKEAAALAIKKLKATEFGNRILINVDNIRPEDISEIMLVPEPAAAFNAFRAECGTGGISPDSAVLVFDMGENDLDITLGTVSILRDSASGKENYALEIKRAYGHTCPGGRDIDRRIVDFLHAELKRRGIVEDWFTRQQIVDKAAEASQALLLQDSVDITLMDGNVTITLSRAKLEELIGDILGQCREGVRRIMNDAGVKQGSISAVVMAGESSLIPAIRKLVEEETGSTSAIMERWDPVMCKARGAAIAVSTGVIEDASGPDAADQDAKRVIIQHLEPYVQEPETPEVKAVEQLQEPSPAPVINAGPMVSTEPARQAVDPPKPESVSQWDIPEGIFDDVADETTAAEEKTAPIIQEPAHVEVHEEPPRPAPEPQIIVSAPAPEPERPVPQPESVAPPAIVEQPAAVIKPGEGIPDGQPLPGDWPVLLGITDDYPVFDEEYRLFSRSFPVPLIFDNQSKLYFCVIVGGKKEWYFIRNFNAGRKEGDPFTEIQFSYKPGKGVDVATQAGKFERIGNVSEYFDSLYKKGENSEILGLGKGVTDSETVNKASTTVMLTFREFPDLLPVFTNAEHNLIQGKDKTVRHSAGTSPALAAAASFFIPGVGQMMAGRTTRGLAIVVAYSILLYTGLAFPIILLPWLGFYLFAIWDAYNVAKKGK